MCLFTLKDAMITPVTSNNCHVSWLLMKVPFLLKDAWSSNCGIDSSLQVSVYLGLIEKARELFRETAPSSFLLPPGMKQQWRLKEEMNRYFPSVIRHRMLTHNLLMELVMAGQRGAPGRLPFHGTPQQRAMLGFTSRREPLN